LPAIRFNPAFDAEGVETRDELKFQIEGRSSITERAGVSGETGSPDCGKSLAFTLGDETMRYLPFSVSLTMKRTRTSWTIAIRVQFQR
jgi:hypothetical protein